jgi:hypothetical protein
MIGTESVPGRRSAAPSSSGAPNAVFHGRRLGAGERYYRAAEALGVEVLFESQVVGLVLEGARFRSRHDSSARGARAR